MLRISGSSRRSRMTARRLLIVLLVVGAVASLAYAVPCCRQGACPAWPRT